MDQKYTDILDKVREAMSLLNQIKQAKTRGGVVIALAKHLGIPVRPVSEIVRSKHPVIAKTT